MELIFFLLGIVVIEAYVWLPKASMWCLERALRRLTPAVRDRYREEWNAHLDDTPASVWKFVSAVSLFAAVGSINSEWADAKRDEIRDVLSELSGLHEHYRKQLETCRTGLDSKSTVLKLTAAISRIPGRDDPRQIVRDTALSAEEFCQQVIVAVIRAGELMLPSLDRASKKLDRAGVFIRAANERNAQIQEFCERGNIASDEFLMLTNALSADLRLAKEELESEGWIDEEALKKAGNITAAIKRAAENLHVIIAG